MVAGLSWGRVVVNGSLFGGERATTDFAASVWAWESISKREEDRIATQADGISWATALRGGSVGQLGTGSHIAFLFAESRKQIFWL